MRTAVVAVAAALLACSSWSPDPDLFGLHLDNRSQVEWANRPDFKPRLRTIVAASLTHLGMTKNELQGIRLVVKDGTIDCGFASSGDETGCWDQTNSTITVSTRAAPCVEVLPIAHELRHVRSGDAFHSGGEWGATDALAEEFAAGRTDECGLPALKRR
jgi:hypothetical protein